MTDELLEPLLIELDFLRILGMKESHNLVQNLSLIAGLTSDASGIIHYNYCKDC